jgi:hypothetical protein
VVNQASLARRSAQCRCPQTVTSVGQCPIHFAWEEKGAAGPQCFKVDLLVYRPAHAATR